MTAAPTEAEPTVLRKVWPAETVMPDGRVLRDTLVVVSRERVYVWAAHGGEPVLLLDSGYDTDGSTLTPEHALRREPMTIVLDGEPRTLMVNRGRGCGCGHPLTRFRPFTTERRGSA